jgi:hypothetical protein
MRSETSYLGRGLSSGIHQAETGSVNSVFWKVYMHGSERNKIWASIFSMYKFIKDKEKQSWMKHRLKASGFSGIWLLHNNHNIALIINYILKSCQTQRSIHLIYMKSKGCLPALKQQQAHHCDCEHPRWFDRIMVDHHTTVYNSQPYKHISRHN